MIINTKKGGTTPTGSLSITANGTYDVTNYASAAVNVSGGGRLPSGYTEYEYLEGSGTQYINTGIIPNSSTGMHIIFAGTINDSSTGDGYSAGSRVGGQPDRFYGPYIVAGELAIGYGSVNMQGWRSYTAYAIYDVYVNYLNDKIIRQGTGTYSLSALTAECTYPLFLFALNYNGSIYTSEAYKGRIYAVEITQGASVTHNYVPAMRNSDSVLGLYDLVTNEFKTNAGTGTFTGGALS